MAKITACDNCGKQSPDEKGKHIANKWMSITVHDSDYYFPKDEKLILCNECMPPFCVHSIKKGSTIIVEFFNRLRGIKSDKEQK